MKFREVAHEWRIVRREPMFRWACFLLAIVTALCLYSGLAFKAARDAQAVAEVTRSLEKRATAKAVLADEAAGRIPVSPWGPGEPNRADWNAARPSGPLAHLSAGREDISPLSATVTLFMTRADTLFKKFQFDSPLALAAGRADAGFLILYILPLFALGLTYNLLAEERDSGRLSLMVAQGAGARRRLALRFGLRILPVVISLLIVLTAALIGGAPGGPLRVWGAAAMLYVVVWIAAAWLIATMRRRQETLAGIAAGLWLLVTLAVPSASMAIAHALFPPISPKALINETRGIEVEANQNLRSRLDAWLAARPEYPPIPEGADDWGAKLYVSQREVEARLAPMLAARAESERAQRRLFGFLSVLSPTAVAQIVMAEAAGTGPTRQAAYAAQAEIFLRQWQEQLSPLIFRRIRLQESDIDGLPRFAFQEQAVSALQPGLAYLFVLAGGLGWLCLRGRGTPLRPL